MTLSETHFGDLGLSEKVLTAVTAAGYTTPTPIQEKAIPIVLDRKDVVGIAQTGTGKTASFVLPMLTRLEQGRARARMPRTLILEPTRELAAQVEENFNRYGVNHKLSVALLIGGVSFEDQIKKLDRGVDVLIATPGRLLDLFDRGRILMTGVEILVIDEADRMLDMGFIPDIERVCKMIPPSRQTLMFSATMPPEIQRLADMFLRDPIRIEAGRPATTAVTVTQKLIASGRESHEKRDVLRDLIRDATDLKNAIIFCNRKRDVQILYRSLEKHGFNVGALHGDMDQRARTATLEGFRNGRIAVLVASDVAARGLDIPDVSHVFNYDVPVHAEDYVHRIGRTGRAGRLGTAIMLVSDLDQKHLAAIERLTRQTIPWMGEPPVPGARAERRRPSEADRSKQSRRDDRADAPVAAAAPRAKRSRAPERPVRPEPVMPDTRPPVTPSSSRPQNAPVARDDASRPISRDDARQPSNRTGRRSVDRMDNRREAEPEVLGLGDHVPAFLLRPTRPARSVG